MFHHVLYFTQSSSRLLSWIFPLLLCGFAPGCFCSFQLPNSNAPFSPSVLNDVCPTPAWYILLHFFQYPCGDGSLLPHTSLQSEQKHKQVSWPHPACRVDLSLRREAAEQRSDLKWITAADDSNPLLPNEDIFFGVPLHSVMMTQYSEEKSSGSSVINVRHDLPVLKNEVWPQRRSVSSSVVMEAGDDDAQHVCSQYYSSFKPTFFFKHFDAKTRFRALRTASFWAPMYNSFQGLRARWVSRVKTFNSCKSYVCKREQEFSMTSAHILAWWPLFSSVLQKPRSSSAGRPHSITHWEGRRIILWTAYAELPFSIQNSHMIFGFGDPSCLKGGSDCTGIQMCRFSSAQPGSVGAVDAQWEAAGNLKDPFRWTCVCFLDWWRLEPPNMTDKRSMPAKEAAAVPASGLCRFF